MNFKRSRTLKLSPVLPSKQARRYEEQHCILCIQPCDEKQKYPSDQEWNIFHANACKWRGLDKYGIMADSVNWRAGPQGKLWHKTCKLNLSGERKLQQAIKRKENASAVVADEKEGTVTARDDDEDKRPATKQSIGPIHDSTLCIWCMKGYDKRHPDKRDTLHLVVNRRTWQRIVASVPYLREKAMRARLELLINATT